MFKALVAASCAAALLFSVSLAHAEDTDWKKGKLGHLASTIGTYDNNKVLNDPAVKKALAEIVPPKMLPILKQNLQVSGGIDFIEGNLVMSGNAPHQGGEETVSIWVAIYDAKVRVYLQTGGSHYLYAKDEQYQFLPVLMRSYLADPNAYNNKVPAYLKWVRSPRS
jgi:hypothetical protein